ncbi:MAG TPA: competence/damage-inducible protein A [Chthoniobacterales bacterium]|nr:competence/damage-inducible protein A [Chthoniobacterales bacterium]
MRVIVINTGTELLLGQVLNTHLSFIAREIFQLGLRVDQQWTVPDGEAIAESLARAFQEADIVFVTGGLGPTTDDVTREAVAALLNLPLRQDPALTATITNRLRSRGFPMTDRILRQADVPEGAAILPNRNGTAPGLYLAPGGGVVTRTPHLFLLPGPPRELQPMFMESVLPIVREIAPERVGLGRRTFRLACIGESVVEAAIGRELLALDGIELGYCARSGEVDVRVLGSDRVLEAAEVAIRNAFPLAVYTVADEELEDVLVRMLRERNASVATAESCTGGYLAHRLTNVAGASAVFGAGYVTYANEAKESALGIEAALIAQYGAVSPEVAEAMALAAVRKAHSTYALATTGIAGPDGGSEEKPVGTVFIALAEAAGETHVQRRCFLTDRQTFKHLTTQTALQMLREHLLANSP